MSEWLRSSTRNRLGLARTGSSPVVPEGGRALHMSMHIFTPSASRALFTGFDSQGVTFSPRHVVRAVKELDSKSIGLCPRRFESCTCRERPPPGFSSVGRAVDCSGVHHGFHQLVTGSIPVNRRLRQVESNDTRFLFSVTKTSGEVGFTSPDPPRSAFGVSSR